MDSQGIPIPLMVAAGGGGIAAIGRFSPRPADLSLVHGKGFNSFLPRPGMSGQGNFKGAGKFPLLFLEGRVEGGLNILFAGWDESGRQLGRENSISIVAYLHKT